MDYINMSNIPTRKEKHARFIIQNEKVRMELDSTDYSITQLFDGPSVRISLIGRDAREVFENFSGQSFSIIEVSEVGEFYYSNLILRKPEFMTKCWRDENEVVTQIEFESSRVK